MDVTMSIEEIVRDEMAAWGRNDVDEVIGHFADEATFDIGPAWPKVSGREAIRELLTQFFAGGRCIELEIRHLAAGRRRDADGAHRSLVAGRRDDQLAGDEGVRGARRHDHRLAGVPLPAQHARRFASLTPRARRLTCRPADDPG